EHLGDAAVAQPGENPRLVLEAPASRLARRRQPQNLDRSPLAQPVALGLEHYAHRAAAKLADNPVRPDALRDLAAPRAAGAGQGRRMVQRPGGRIGLEHRPDPGSNLRRHRAQNGLTLGWGGVAETLEEFGDLPVQ